MTGSAAAVGAWLVGAGWVWLVGGLLFIAVVPFTLIQIKPVNDALMEIERDPESGETLELLQRWGRLHAVRSVLSGLGLLLFLGGLTFG